MKFVPNKLSRIAAEKAFLASKHSPRILFVAGTVGMIGTTVLACKATLKLEGVLEDAEIEIAQASKQGTLAVEDQAKDYHEKDYQKDMLVLHIRHAQRVARLYAPAAALGLISVACLTKSHSILNKRNASLTIAYATVEKAFDEYRDRVREQYGDEKEKEIYRAVETVEIEDQKTGKIQKVKVPGTPGIYARFYDEFARNWQSDAEANRIFLDNQQNWANDKLQQRGFLFLNEVYDMLGLDMTEIGQYAGWILDGSGDGYIDFGIYDTPRSRDFVNGYEPSVLLDFNCQGNIVSKIGNKK